MRNGAGQYNPPNSSWFPATNGVLATASDWTALLNDISAALTQSVSRDGQSPMLGNLPMGNNKITGLSAGTGSGDAATWAQLFGASTQADIASAATTDIGVQNTSFLRVTGTTTITSFGDNFRGPRFLTFADAVTLTNSSTLVLPGGANITTAAGDSLIVVPGATLGTADKWVVVAFQSNSVPGSPSAGSVTNASLADGAVYGTKLTSKIEPVTASVASNALTVTLNPTALDFRSAALGSGAVNTRTIATAISAVIPSGATLGTTNAVLSKVTLIALDNAGTVELAVCNGSLSLDESTLISTAALNADADSATVVYSTTARTNVPFRVVGYVESTQSTAGTWASAPSKIQGAGGLVNPTVADRASTITSATAVTASGTSVDFTGIPSWVKRITVMFAGVSTSGSSVVQIQMGSAMFSTSGYQCNASYGTQNSLQYIYSTSGFPVEPAGQANASCLRSGSLTFSLISGTTWVGSGNVGGGTSPNIATNSCAGVSPALSGTLDRIRITTVNGTDTFDAGTINISYEG
jgi:hypothetical protein